jgi:predicted DNA-binding protein (MmcQ/YjbR family)
MTSVATTPGNWTSLDAPIGLTNPFAENRMKKSAVKKILEQVRAICLALPETTEVEAWGHPTFRAPKKIFAAFGTDDGWGPTLGLKVGFDRQEELLKDPRFFPTPYAARQGWVSLKMDGKIDWDEVRALVREAYKQVALKRMLKAIEDA